MYTDTHLLPEILLETVERELESGEKIVWLGQPKPYYFSLSIVGPMVFAVPWTGFTVLWMCAASKFKIPDFTDPFQLLFSLFGLPFLCIGFLLLASPILQHRRLKNTVYVITDKYVRIITRGFFKNTNITHDPEDVANLVCKEKSDGLGDIIFSDCAQPDMPDFISQMVTGSGFFGITDIANVEKLLKRLAAMAEPEDSEEEETPKTLDDYPDPTMLETFGQPPRIVSLSARLYLLLCSGHCVVLGWIFAAVGMGMIAGILHTHDDKSGVYEMLFIIGVCSIFFFIGMGFVIYSYIVGSKSIRLLETGNTTKGLFIAMTGTNVRVNNQQVMKLDFEYAVDGQKHTVAVRALDTSRLLDDDCEIVFYDPMQPETAIVFDGLPHGIQFDSLSETFNANPLRFTLPMIGAIVVAAGLASIVIFAFMRIF